MAEGKAVAGAFQGSKRANWRLMATEPPRSSGCCAEIGFRLAAEIRRAESPDGVRADALGNVDERLKP